MGRFNFGNQPNIGGDGGGNNYSANGYEETATVTEEYYGDEPDEKDEYFATLKDLWLCIGFCIAGWIIACVGFATVASSDLGILLVMIGVIVVDLPCFKILLAGGSLAMLFGSIVGAERIIYYSDGTKERDNSAWSAGMAVTIFTWLATLVVGVFAMVFRIFKNFMHLLSLKKEVVMEKSVKTAPWLPIVVGLGVFVGGLVAVGIYNSAVEYQESVRDDFSDEETREMIEGIAGDMTERDWSFKFWSGSTDPYLIVEHKYSAVDNARAIYITITGEGTEYLGIDAGYYGIGIDPTEPTYYADLNAEGIATGEITDSELQAKLDMFTPESILAADKMLADIEKVYAYDNESDQGGMYDETEYKLTFKEKGTHGYEQEIYAGTEDGKWKVRIVDSPYNWAEPFYIEFRYN